MYSYLADCFSVDLTQRGAEMGKASKDQRVYSNIDVSSDTSRTSITEKRKRKDTEPAPRTNYFR